MSQTPAERAREIVDEFVARNAGYYKEDVIDGDTDEMIARITASLTQSQNEVERLRKAIEDEPELPGEMPDEMWNAMNGNREQTTLFMQFIVKTTKRNILARVPPSALSAPSPASEKGGEAT